MRPDEVSTTPWYKQFWPWVVIGLPMSSVVAGLATVVIAVTHQDSLVRDDWYKDGMAVNRRLAADERARELGLWATLRVAPQSGEVSLTLEGAEDAAPQLLDLELSHATQADRDRVLRLVQIERGEYRSGTTPALEGRWYATLYPVTANADDESSWRISRRLDLSQAEGEDAPVRVFSLGRPPTDARPELDRGNVGRGR